MSKVADAKNRRKIIHPFLVAVFPVLIIYSQNVGRVNFEEVVIPIIFVLILSIGLYYFLKIILKNAYKAALVVTILLIILFSYGHIYYLLNDVSIDGFDVGRNRYLIPIFGITLVTSIFFVLRAKKVFDNVTSIINFMSVIFVIVAISNVGFVVYEMTECETCPKQAMFYERIDFSKYFEEHKFVISDDNIPPDVYYLILDEYARSDALSDYHNFDNDEFTEYLESKGFHVAKNSFTNYPMSIQAIPATMNMQYVNFLADEIGTEVRNYKPLNEKDYGLYPNNMVIKNFKEMDYKIITFNTFALHLHENPLADEKLCYKTKFLFENRILDILGRISIFGYYVERWAEGEHRQVILCTFEKLPAASNVFEEPVFVWAHVMLPHPPWVFGPNGEEITPGKPLLITDNPEFRDSGWEPKKQYVQQVEFANKKTIEAIEGILEHNSNSIIIIQGDHGTSWGVNWEEPSRDDIWQRMRNFDAIYFPDEEKRQYLTDDRTLVNTFRVVFNTYFNSDYEILDDKMYWGYNKKPYIFEDVTEVIAHNAIKEPNF